MSTIKPEILFYAFRYALGRKTYVVDDVVNSLLDNWVYLSNSDQCTIEKEIRKAIKNNDAGMLQDVEKWKKVLKIELVQSE